MVETIAVLRSFPLLGLQPGDVVVVEPGGEEPIGVWRVLPPNYDAILGLLDTGAGRPLNQNFSSADLAAAVGSSSPAAPVSDPALPQHPGWHRRHLQRVK